MNSGPESQALVQSQFKIEHQHEKNNNTAVRNRITPISLGIS